MKLGCHAVLFKERIKSETEAMIKGLSETGFQGSEIGSRFFGVDDKGGLERILKKYNYQISGVHVGCPLQEWLEKEDECNQKVINVAEFVKGMPNKNVIMSGSTFGEGDVEVLAARIEKAAKNCLQMGVRLHYHNHAWEFENDGRVFNALVKYAPSLFFALDLGWVYKGGFEPIETLIRCADRVSYVHLRDYNNRVGKEFVSIGQGMVDFNKLMRILRDILGQDGWAIVEYEDGEQDFGRYKEAMKYLKDFA